VARFIINYLLWLSFNRSSGVDASRQAVDPISFDQVEVNQGGLYNAQSGLVTISVTGYYYVYMSVAAQSGLVSIQILNTSYGTVIALYSTKIIRRVEINVPSSLICTSCLLSL
jgi:C1q domain